MVKYILRCSKCKKQTLHEISKINRKRGVKLCCLNCSKETKTYHSLTFLKEAKPND